MGVIVMLPGASAAGTALAANTVDRASSRMKEAVAHRGCASISTPQRVDSPFHWNRIVPLRFAEGEVARRVQESQRQKKRAVLSNRPRSTSVKDDDRQNVARSDAK
jgi:hypothetical protein